MAACHALWDIETGCHARAFQHQMRLFTPSPVRALRVASALFLLSLISTAFAEAAPVLRRGAAGPMCDAETVMLKALRRLPKSFGGPLKVPRRRAVTVSTDATARVVHAP